MCESHITPNTYVSNMGLNKRPDYGGLTSAEGLTIENERGLVKTFCKYVFNLIYRRLKLNMVRTGVNALLMK